MGITRAICTQDAIWQVGLRSTGELSTIHQERQMKMVLAPAGAPVDLIFRGCYCLKIAQTSKTQEKLGLKLKHPRMARVGVLVVDQPQVLPVDNPISQ